MILKVNGMGMLYQNQEDGAREGAEFIKIIL
jgi:hypothetical protein